MEIPHDTVFVEASNYQALSFWVGILAEAGHTVVVNGLDLAMSQDAWNAIEGMKNENY